MIGGEFLMSLFRSVFREQKTRLQLDWLTHTDELIMEDLAGEERDRPDEIADRIDRSVEYVSDRCRQLALRGLLEAVDPDKGVGVEYRLADLGRRYLAGDIDADGLEEHASVSESTG